MKNMTGGIVPTALLLFACCQLAGCGTPPPIPVGDPGLRVPLETVKIKAPPGEGWDYFTEKRAGREYVVFMKRGETPSHHFAADVAEIDRPGELQDSGQILELVLQPFVDDYFADRTFEVTGQEAVPDTRFGELGVRFSFEAQDFEAPGRGEAAHLQLRMWGYAFIHPERPKTVVIMAMNERGHVDEFGDEGAAVGEEFFSGLTLK